MSLSTGKHSFQTFFSFLKSKFLDVTWGSTLKAVISKNSRIVILSPPKHLETEKFWGCCREGRLLDLSMFYTHTHTHTHTHTPLPEWENTINRYQHWDDTDFRFSKRLKKKAAKTMFEWTIANALDSNIKIEPINK